MGLNVAVRLSDVKTCFEEWIVYVEFTSGNL